MVFNTLLLSDNNQILINCAQQNQKSVQYFWVNRLQSQDESTFLFVHAHTELKRGLNTKANDHIIPVLNETNIKIGLQFISGVTHTHSVSLGWGRTNFTKAEPPETKTLCQYKKMVLLTPSLAYGWM